MLEFMGWHDRHETGSTDVRVTRVTRAEVR